MNAKQRIRVINLLKRSREVVERYVPDRAHEGPCTPESGCDASCQEHAYICTLLGQLDQEVKELEGKPAKLIKRKGS